MAIIKNPSIQSYDATVGDDIKKSENTFNKWANRILKRIFNDKFTLSTLRHIFITRRDLQMETKSGLEQEKLARQMGHSIEQQKQYMWHIWLQEQEGKSKQKGSESDDEKD